MFCYLSGGYWEPEKRRLDSRSLQVGRMHKPARTKPSRTKSPPAGRGGATPRGRNMRTQLTFVQGQIFWPTLECRGPTSSRPSRPRGKGSTGTSLLERQPFEDGRHSHNQIKPSEDQHLHPDFLLMVDDITPGSVHKLAVVVRGPLQIKRRTLSTAIGSG